jgi:antitoxin component YwqK of YwqJK toxin-antitoxin module
MLARSNLEITSMLAALLFLLGCSDEGLHRDKQGEIHGTGEKVYRYDTGEVMLREKYVEGELVDSWWYKPDGTVIKHTDWQDESGVGLYLYQDGSIEARMHYVNGVADGKATFYDKDGNVKRVVQYKDGEKVKVISSATSRPAHESTTQPSPDAVR